MKVPRLVRGIVRLNCPECERLCVVEWWAGTKDSWMEPGDPPEWECSDGCVHFTANYHMSDWQDTLVWEMVEDCKYEAIDRMIEERKERICERKRGSQE